MAVHPSPLVDGENPGFYQKIYEDREDMKELDDANELEVLRRENQMLQQEVLRLHSDNQRLRMESMTAPAYHLRRMLEAKENHIRTLQNRDEFLTMEVARMEERCKLLKSQ